MSTGPSPAAGSIADVLDDLAAVIESARSSGSRLGYFPALYRKVTVAVAKGIEENAFEDGARMEELDVRFARRYLDALGLHRAGQAPTRSWRVCFEATADPSPIVLQHLLLGMNAHINLDLGIAAAQTAPGAALPGLRRDFEEINRILVSMIDEVQRDLARVWPWLMPLDWIAGRSEERLAGFSMETARDHAWRLAETLAPMDAEAQAPVIDWVDRMIGAFGSRIHRPGWPLRWAQRAVRIGERGGPATIIDALR